MVEDKRNIVLGLSKQVFSYEDVHLLIQSLVRYWVSQSCSSNVDAASDTVPLCVDCMVQAFIFDSGIALSFDTCEGYLSFWHFFSDQLDLTIWPSSSDPYHYRGPFQRVKKHDCPYCIN